MKTSYRLAGLVAAILCLTNPVHAVDTNKAAAGAPAKASAEAQRSFRPHCVRRYAPSVGSVQGNRSTFSAERSPTARSIAPMERSGRETIRRREANASTTPARRQGSYATTLDCFSLRRARVASGHNRLCVAFGTTHRSA